MHGLLLAVAAFTAQAQGPLHYKVESSTLTDVDMSGMGMPAQHLVVKSWARISVTMSDTVGGKLAHVVIDSVDFDGGEALKQAMTMGAFPPEAMANGTGTTFHCFLPTGKDASCGDPSTPAISAASVAAAFPYLFVGIKPTAKVGDTWADSVKKDTTIAAPGLGNMPGAIVSHSTWKATSQSGQNLVLDVVSSGTLSAAIPNGAGNMDMITSGTQHLVGSAGRPVREATVTNKATGKLNLMGSAIPVTATTTVTIMSVP